MIEIFERILEEAKSRIQAEMEAKNINASGRTSASFRVERTLTGVRLVMGGPGTAPLESLEVGEPPGYRPKGFTEILAEWSRAKGLGFSSERERRSFAYLLGRRIMREGTLRHQHPEDVYTTIVLETADQVKIQASVAITKYIHELLKK